MLGVDQRIFNKLAKQYPVQNKWVQALMMAKEEQADQMIDNFWNPLDKRMSQQQNVPSTAASALVDAMILQQASNSIEKFVNNNPMLSGALPVVTTMEEAIWLVGQDHRFSKSECQTLTEWANRLVEEYKKMGVF
ncbi:MAG: hypothetical protein RR066_08590 [Mucinivorans sp.]